MGTQVKPKFTLYKCDCGHTVIQENIYTVHTYDKLNTRDLCDKCWQDAPIIPNGKISDSYDWKFISEDLQTVYNQRQ